MQVTETNAEGLKREFAITVPAADIQAQVTAKLEEIARTIRLPGFRPGKAPIGVLRQRFAKSITGEVLETQVNESSQKAMDDRGLRPAVPPKVEELKFEEGADLEFRLAVEIMPEIAPMDFATLELERPTAEVAVTSIDEAVERLASNIRKTRPLAEPRPAQSGDVAVIDFVGRLDGEAFAGGSAEGYELELGAGNFVPGFEEQLIGASAGDKREVTIQMPEDYGAEHLAGKEVVFDVEVKELKEREPVEVNEETAASFGFETLEALREAVKGRIESEYAALSRARVKRVLFDKLDEAHRFEVPASLAEQEFQAIWGELKQQLEGPNGETVREGKSDEELESEYRRVADRRVRLGLLLAEVGRLNNISVSQDDLGRALRAEAARYPGQEDKVLEFYRNTPGAMARLQAPILEEKVVDFILELARVTQKTVTPEELVKEAEGEDSGT
ncbi:MAG: trigger factor [Alphaproteobacteria bacterium]